CRRPLGLVKFAVPQFLDLSLKRCTLSGVCGDDLQTISSTIPPSPARQLAGSFFKCQALPTTGANGRRSVMFGENGFCHEGIYSTEPNESQNGGDRMDYQNKEMAHAQSYQFVTPDFRLIWNSPWTG